MSQWLTTKCNGHTYYKCSFTDNLHLIYRSAISYCVSFCKLQTYGGGPTMAEAMVATASTINAKCCHVNSQFRRGFVLSTVDTPLGFHAVARKARDDRDRSSRLSAYAAAPICVRWTENVGTVQTQFRASGFQSGFDVEDDQPERPAHGRSENRCSGRHPGHPQWPLHHDVGG